MLKAVEYPSGALGASNFTERQFRADQPHSRRVFGTRSVDKREAPLRGGSGAPPVLSGGPVSREGILATILGLTP